MRFPYIERRARSGAGEPVWLPAIPVTILAPNNGRAPGPVRVDSGAERTHIPRRVVERLGISLEGAPQLTLAWGEHPEENKGVSAPAGFRVIVEDVIVPIRPVVGDDPRPVLGQDFFESFRITFDRRSRVIELEPHADVPRVRVRHVDFPGAA